VRPPARGVATAPGAFGELAVPRRPRHRAGLRTQIFTRTFPRCGIHEPFGDWAAYADFIGLLTRLDAIAEATQLWWSVRPHHSFGTVELRICDAQTRGEESFALAGLITACIAQAALDYDDGRLPDPLPQREIEENLWRAIRYGLDGTQIDFTAERVIPTRAAIERLCEWTDPARSQLGIECDVPESNGTIRARAALAEGGSITDIYREAVAETRRTYAPEVLRAVES
jgi:carboxylate-amine ligase